MHYLSYRDGPTHPHRCFQLLQLIRASVERKVGGAMLEIMWHHQSEPIKIMAQTATQQTSATKVNKRAKDLSINDLYTPTETWEEISNQVAQVKTAVGVRGGGGLVFPHYFIYT